ncbi:MFS transporter [Streptomyces sp. NRRL F-5135]|uniref:MFS transporter n=1 Tax=Streptomyces sp. NRRL F-5135 TaxID=1463858 RepID=UPI0004CC0BC5|nr:MFS transporter [Streptomyces sp. NRRL F-5135]
MTTENQAARTHPGPPSLPEPSARSTGLRLGALFGPAIFGVTAAGVALPDVVRALGTSPSAAAWVLTAHALALGIGTALAGRVADARGIRFILLTGGLILAAGAVVCLVAPGIGVLVAGRFLLAAGSGAMSSAALALAASATPRQRPGILAIFGATMSLFSAGATLAGGVVTEWFGWRPTLVLPVLSLLALPLVLRQAATRPGTGRSVDGTGALLLTVTAACFLILIQSSALSLSAPAVTVVAVLLVLAAAGLVVRTAKNPEGFVPRALVTDLTFVRAAGTGVGVYAGLFGTMYAAPQLLVRGHGWDVLSVGLWLLPGAVLGAVLSRYASSLAGAGGNVLLTVTALACAALLGLAGLLDGGPVFVVLGASLGFAAFAVTQVVTTGLLSARTAPQRRGGAVALLNLTFFVGGGVGSAVAGALAKSMELASVLAVVAVFPLLGAVFALTLPRAAPGPQGPPR